MSSSDTPLSNASRSPPPAPNPSQDTNLIPRIASPHSAETPPPQLLQDAEDGQLDLDTVLPEIAMKLLARSVEALALITGDIPATPAATPKQPFGKEGILGTPSGKENRGEERDIATPLKEFQAAHSRNNSRPQTPTPVPDADLRRPSFKPVSLSSPEASLHEPPIPLVATPPSPTELAKTLSAEAKRNEEAAARRDAQTASIARKFFSKSVPPIGLDAYLNRLQRYCPMSTAVWLAAAYYISILSVSEKHPMARSLGSDSPLVPLTPRTIHRLLLAALRVAMKALEDLRYPQARFAGVGGVSETELKSLEISLCYLMDFELQVDDVKLVQGVVELHRAREAAEKMRFSISGASGGGFKLMKEGLTLRMKNRGGNGQS